MMMDLMAFIGKGFILIWRAAQEARQLEFENYSRLCFKWGEK
jgi:hypothetical protein